MRFLVGEVPLQTLLVQGGKLMGVPDSLGSGLGGRRGGLERGFSNSGSFRQAERKVVQGYLAYKNPDPPRRTLQWPYA